jgi:hypothetical protein
MPCPHPRRLAHHEHRTHWPARLLGDPAALPLRIEAAHETRNDLGHQGLEARVVAELARIERALALHHPAHVAGLGAAQHDRLGRRSACGGRRSQCAFDAAQRLDQLGAAGVIEVRDQSGSLRAGSSLERREGLAALGRERQRAAAGVARVSLAPHQAARGEAAQDAAQVAAVQRQFARQIHCGHAVALRQLVEHAHLGQREAAGEQPLVEQAERTRVEAAEAAQGRDRGLRVHRCMIRPMADRVNLLPDAVSETASAAQPQRQRSPRAPCRPHPEHRSGR